jgi:hypothetical protein
MKTGIEFLSTSDPRMSQFEGKLKSGYGRFKEEYLKDQGHHSIG